MVARVPWIYLGIGCLKWVPRVPVIWDWFAWGDAKFPGIGVELIWYQ